MKKQLLRILAGTMAVGAVAIAVIYFFFPQVLLGVVQWNYERKSGVVEKSIKVDGYTIPYYEGGKGKPLVLLHGFGDSKISFVQAAQWLTPHFRVILPEVPGFGRTVKDPSRNHSIRAQVETFRKFFQKLGLKRMALGGNSMGGHIAAAYALRYPKEVERLLLLNAAGMRTHDTKMPYKPVKNPVKDREGFHRYMKKLFYKIPPIPRPFESYLIQQMVKNARWMEQLRTHIRSGKDYLLNERAKAITVPTLILWGDSDRIVYPSVGHAYRKALRNDVWVWLKRCGHIPQYERPRETAEIMLRFLRRPTPALTRPSRPAPSRAGSSRPSPARPASDRRAAP